MLLTIYYFCPEFEASTEAMYFPEEPIEYIDSFTEAVGPLSAFEFYFTLFISLSFELSYLSNYCSTDLFSHQYSKQYSAKSNYY